MAAISGQTTVTTAGTEVVLGTLAVQRSLMIKALDTNTGVVVVGHVADGVVAVSTGMRLLPGEVVIFEHVGNLNSIMVDSAVNGEGVAWLALDV